MTKLGSKLPSFVRITAIVAIALVALFVLLFLVKIVIVAAVLAAIVVAFTAVWKMIRRRRTGVATLAARR